MSLPSDSNGVYSLPSGYLAVTGETIQASQHNPPLEDMASSMTQRMMRSGVTPMTGALKIVDGSSGSPGVQFSTGSSTGLYRTTGGIGVAIGGTKVAEFGAGGMISGARWIGELVPFTGLTAPALTVLPYGQTLSRTTYADLWTFAQAEIAAGNAFYNNGNGTTTFGIGDMRGRVPAGKDNMGGTDASRLPSTYLGAVATTLGNAGGTASQTLTTSHIPVMSISGTATGSVTVQANRSDIALSSSSVGLQAGGNSVPIVAGTTQVTSTGTASLSVSGSLVGAGGNPHSIVQPTMVCNYLLFAGA